ncbi:MAG TPA: hypothetical protein VJS92_17760 [Candidatus Polarisedimenticolaceae bacterium]|nr:hypothetical protein [Candidatus Polarisedimenticolaceae bacterium]
MSVWGIRAAAGLLLFAAAPAAAAEAPARVWHILWDGREIGKETARQSAGGGQWTLESSADVAYGGPSSYQQKTVVDETGACVSYSLTLKAQGFEQLAVVERTAGGVRFVLTAGGQTRQREETGKAPILCLDNMVFSQWLILGRELAKNGSKPATFSAAVPQQMSVRPARFEPGAPLDVKIGGQTFHAMSGRITVGSVAGELVYDAAAGIPFRISFPAQKLEAVYDGWEGPAPATRAAATP